MLFLHIYRSIFANSSSLYIPNGFSLLNLSMMFSDPYDSVTCQNEGTCLASDGSFTCNCLDGYTGTLCETGRYIYYIYISHFFKIITFKQISLIHLSYIILILSLFQILMNVQVLHAKMEVHVLMQ